MDKCDTLQIQLGKNKVFTQFIFNCKLCHCHLTPINGIVVCSTINPFQYAFSEWSSLPLGASLMTHHVLTIYRYLFRMRLKPEVSSRMTWWDVKTNTKQKQQKPFTDLVFTCLPYRAMLDGMCVKNTNDLKWNTSIRNVCTKVN